MLLLFIAAPAAADHPSPPCFDDHEGFHDFPFTTAKAELEFSNDARLGPFAGKTVDLQMDGPTRVEAQATSGTTMDTEIVEMVLVGTHPELGAVTVIENRVVASPGSVTAASATQCYAASSEFDVFFEVRVNGIAAHNDDPKEMSATLDNIPPAPGDVYEGPDPVAFFAGAFHGDPAADHGFFVGWLRAAEHTPTPGGTVGGFVIEDSTIPREVGSPSLVITLLAWAGFLALSRRRQ